MSSITRLGFSSGDEGSAMEGNPYGGVLDQMADQIETLRALFEQAEAGRGQTDAYLVRLTEAVVGLSQKIDATDVRPALQEAAEAQMRLAQKLQDSGVDGIDAESRMRLRSIDVQLLKILEELSSGRQETVGELRGDLANITRMLRATKRPTGTGHS